MCPDVAHIVSAFRFVRQRAWNLRRDILNECASQRDVEELRSTADREYWFPGLARSEYKRYFSLIARAVHGAETLMPRLSIEGGIDVFTTGEHETVDGVDYGARGRRVKKWGNDDWYEPC
jgi:hypothetical protein